MVLAFRWDQSATDTRPRELPLDWVAPRPTARMDCRRIESMISIARHAFGADHADTALPDTPRRFGSSTYGGRVLHAVACSG